MAKRASEWIPHNILDAARRARLPGLKTPQLYLGRNNGHEQHDRQMTLRQLDEKVREAEAQRERQAGDTADPEAPRP